MKKIALWLCGHILACGIGCFPASAQGLDLDWEAEIFGAHRKDRITSLIKAYDPPGNLVLTDSLIAKNIHVIEGGLRGRAALCSGLFIKGFGSLGVINYGVYNENSHVHWTPTVRGRAKTNHGNVQDCSAGLGYQYEFNSCMRAGVSAGWAYDAQAFKLSHAYFKVPDRRHPERFAKDPAFILYGVRYKNRWQGPWAGVETRIYLPCVTLDLGYEFHVVQWHAQWRLRGDDVIGSAFSDRRHSNQCYGNVGSINVNYNFFQCWTIAIGARYNYFKATHGRKKPLAGSFSDIGKSDTEVDKVRKATWQSFAMQMFLGYGF